MSGNRGRGINNYGTLDVVDSTVSDNTGTHDGGGIFNAATANLTNAAVSGNSAGSGGGVYNARRTRR